MNSFGTTTTTYNIVFMKQYDVIKKNICFLKQLLSSLLTLEVGEELRWWRNRTRRPLFPLQIH